MATLKGSPGVSICRPHASPIVRLVLPFGAMPFTADCIAPKLSVSGNIMARPQLAGVKGRGGTTLTFDGVTGKMFRLPSTASNSVLGIEAVGVVALTS